MDWLNVLLKCAQWRKCYQNWIIFSAVTSFSFLRLVLRNQRAYLSSVLSIQNWLNFAELDPFHERVTCSPVCINLVAVKVASDIWWSLCSKFTLCPWKFVIPADADIVLFVSEARIRQLFPCWLDSLAAREITCAWVSWGLTTSPAAWAAAKVPF